jgi:hypothetical protein
MKSVFRATKFFVRTVLLSDDSKVYNVSCLPLGAGPEEFVDVLFAVNEEQAIKVAADLDAVIEAV